MWKFTYIFHSSVANESFAYIGKRENVKVYFYTSRVQPMKDSSYIGEWETIRKFIYLSVSNEANESYAYIGEWGAKRVHRFELFYKKLN